MKNLIVISRHWEGKKFNVDLWAPNTGRERDGYMGVGKEFNVGIRRAKKESLRLADLYNAEIEDRTGLVFKAKGARR